VKLFLEQGNRVAVIFYANIVGLLQMLTPNLASKSQIMTYAIYHRLLKFATIILGMVQKIDD